VSYILEGDAVTKLNAILCSVPPLNMQTALLEIVIALARHGGLYYIE